MLGVLDWGVGSLFSVQRLRSLHPSVDVVVFSDAGSTPYGLQPRRQLARRVEWAVQQLANEGVSEVLLACHAASTVLPIARCVVPVVGVINANGCPPGERVGVVGGRRTVRSQAWRRLLCDRTVAQRVAQPWSALVEQGLHNDEVLQRALDAVLRGLPAVDVLVLACTHYPALTPWLEQRLPSTVLWDPAGAVVERLHVARGSGVCRALTTGPPAALERMAAALEIPLTVSLKA